MLDSTDKSYSLTVSFHEEGEYQSGRLPKKR